MPTDSDAVKRPANNRSNVSNGTHLYPKLDGRSATARRTRDLIASFTADLGGSEGLSEVERQAVRRAAAAMIRVELLEAAMLNGEHVDDAEMTRAQHSAMRSLAFLNAGRKKPRRTSSLDAYLNEKGKAVRP